MRFAQGLPDAKAAKPYMVAPSLCFKKDNAGKGGTLWIEPALEPGDLDDLWDVEDLIDQLLPLRAELLDGDLRHSIWHIWPSSAMPSTIPNRRARLLSQPA